ncbi:MAG: cation transporter, partial [Phycisphaerae bacterium]
MKISDKFELPAAREADAVHAERLEWLTLAYLLSVIVLMYLVMGSSQTMKTAWIEDILSAIPPLAYLVADRVRKKPPDLRYPYGYHRAVTIAFLLAAFANLALGVYLAIDSAITLLEGQHPTIGSFHLFGRTIWLGWLMIAVLLWGVIPAFIIGRMKLPVARRLHDKTLHADADMNKADWLTGLAAIGGILGIGYGLWWADAVAALII